MGEHNRFLEELDDYCRVATGVVRTFAGEWYSLHRFRQDITIEKSRGFAAHAIEKIRMALRYKEGRDVE